MIPMELEIRNFLSYRAPAVLDLREIHVACISGRNGAGKSSILEAMIWALFGKSRAPTEEDLVNRTARLAGEHMEVRFIFALGDTTYRILRRRRKSDSVLEFALQTADEEWLTLTEGGKRETQAAIDDTLRMSYETFVNASFLQQGQADAFTTQTPARRKEILADVLGVQAWEQHRARFSVRRKATENERLLLQGKMEDTAAELAQREIREAELAAALAAQADVTETLAAQTALRDQARRAAEARKAQLAQQRALTAQLERLAEQRSTKMAERDQLAALQAADEALLAGAEETTARHAQWRAADQAQRQWEAVYREATRLREAQAAAEREVTAAAADLERRIAALEATEARLANQADEETVLRAQQVEWQAALAAAEAQQTARQAAAAALQVAERTLQQRENEQKSVARDMQRLTAAAAQAAAQRQEQQQLAPRRTALEADVVRLESAQQVRQGLLQRRNELHGHIQALQQAQPRLKEEMDDIKERLDRLEAEHGGACPLCGQALTADHRHTVIADLQQQGRKRGDAWRTNRQQLAAHEEERRRLEAQLADSARDEGQLAAAQRSLSTLEARVAELARLQMAWEQEGAVELSALEARAAELAPALAALRQDVADQQAALADRAAAEQELRRLRDTLAGTDARLEQMALEATAWAAEGSESLASLRATLATEAFAPEARRDAAALATQLAALAYDGEAHAQARETAQALADAEAAFNRLQTARTAVSERQHTLELYARQLAEQEESLAGFRAQLQGVADTLVQLGDEDGSQPALEARVLELQRKAVDANGMVGHARSKVDTLVQMAERERTLLAERDRLQRQLGRLQLLEKACSRDGVQALLIEHALPDIEERANQLLERLTGGEMSVVFDTQRALKTRDGMRETLDIRIIDRAGERPYENYSGGEQFRVNFAIRLALSQALAHRSGAALSTLVIDEGFGSQDPQGRDRLVEAINEIQDEFARILVITHVEELKDAFPARIVVEKLPAGSVITVNL